MIGTMIEFAISEALIFKDKSGGDKGDRHPKCYQSKPLLLFRLSPNGIRRHKIHRTHGDGKEAKDAVMMLLQKKVQGTEVSQAIRDCYTQIQAGGCHLPPEDESQRPGQEEHKNNSERPQRESEVLFAILDQQPRINTQGIQKKRGPAEAFQEEFHRNDQHDHIEEHDEEKHLRAVVKKINNTEHVKQNRRGAH